MQQAQRFPLTGLSKFAGPLDNEDLTSGEYPGESGDSCVIPLVASALLPFLHQRIGFYTPGPPRLRLPVFPYPLHRFSGRKVLDAPRHHSRGARLFPGR